MGEIQIWSRLAGKKRLELKAIIKVVHECGYMYPLYNEIDVSPLFNACKELVQSGQIGLKKQIGDIEYFFYYFPHAY